MIERHIVGLLRLPNSNWFAYHRLEGFAGKNFVDPGRGYPYYLGFGGWVDRKFVGHRLVGYHGDNHPTLLFGSVGFYRRKMPEVVDSTESNGGVAPRESYDNYRLGDYPHNGCTPPPSQSNTYLAPKCEPYRTWGKLLCRCSGLDLGRGLVVDGEVGLQGYL